MFKIRSLYLPAIKSFSSKATKSKTKKIKSGGWFANVPIAPPDAILGMQDDFEKDSDPKKVNCSVGAYRDWHGQPYVLPSIRQAEKRIYERQMDMEYVSSGGLKVYNDCTAELVLGSDCQALLEGRVVSVQTIGGSGALNIAASLISRHFEGNKVIHLSQPTWHNHAVVFGHQNVAVQYYRYYDQKKKALDFCGMMDDIQEMPKNSIILFQPCAHNPTGIDLTNEQWMEVQKLVQQKNLLCVMDFAYQGFASGMLDTDARAVQIFEQAGHKLLIAQTFSKNMGLYGQRTGTFHAICSNKQEAERIASQVCSIVRGNYSEPPLHGARLAAEVMTDEELCTMWQDDLSSMIERLVDVRKQLRAALEATGSSMCFEPITQQRGLYWYTGLTPEQVECLITDKHIYMPRNGRLLVAGLTMENIEYVADCIYQVTEN